MPFQHPPQQIFMDQKTYHIIVDTDEQWGFEYEAILFATGLLGESDVTRQKHQHAQMEPQPATLTWWKDHFRLIPQKVGPSVVTDTCPTLGFFNNGFGKSYKDTPEGEKMALSFYKNFAKTSSFLKQEERLNNIVVGQNGWSEELLKREKLRLHPKNINKHPSYQSFFIKTNSIPPQEIVDDFKTRITLFLKQKGVKVLGFGLETYLNDIKQSERIKL